MINALVITNNIHFIQKLLDESNSKNLDIKLSGIAINKSETHKLIKTLEFNIIFLDEEVKNDYTIEFLKSYKGNIITLSYGLSSELINSNTLKKIHTIVDKNDLEKRKIKVIKELEYIGYKFKYKGTHYLVDTILQMYINQNNMVDNLQSSVYPIIAEKYNKTIYNVKSSINKATECMYYECDSSKLESYFKFSDDTKPTVKQVIFTIINKI